MSVSAICKRGTDAQGWAHVHHNVSSPLFLLTSGADTGKKSRSSPYMLEVNMEKKSLKQK